MERNRMKRRTFGLLASTSMLAISGLERSAFGQVAAVADPSLLKTTLTPMGSERAGNAAGTIPAWTGGMTQVPAGINWDPQTLPPDFFAGDAILYEIDSSNMEQYKNLLTEGVQTLIQTRGFSLKVYPTHRTAAAPQYVYDNIAQNVTRSKLDPAGGRLGFTGGYGGYPFPIPDTTKPYDAGAQIVWNDSNKWTGLYLSQLLAAFVVQDGGEPILSSYGNDWFYYPYYDPNGSPATFQGYSYKFLGKTLGPAQLVGNEQVYFDTVNPAAQPIVGWELLSGQGRVRKAPEVEYDTPDSATDDEQNYDETDGFSGALNEYDWKYLYKTEMLIPYNNNKLFQTTVEDAHGPYFINPDVLRWELHRVWVVEATLHPGNRNVMVRRMLHIDEDTWVVGITDTWDANGNIYHCSMNANAVFPNLPGTIFSNSFLYNLQTGDYLFEGSFGGRVPYSRPWSFEPIPMSTFDPQTMAAAAAY
jgi:hypothetical protein